jgi:hypothetical protein
MNLIKMPSSPNLHYIKLFMIKKLLQMNNLVVFIC